MFLYTSQCCSLVRVLTNLIFADGILYAVNGEPAEGGRTCGYTIDYESGNVIGEWCPFVSQQLTRPHDVTAINETVSVFLVFKYQVLSCLFVGICGSIRWFESSSLCFVFNKASHNSTAKHWFF